MGRSKQGIAEWRVLGLGVSQQRRMGRTAAVGWTERPQSCRQPACPRARPSGRTNGWFTMFYTLLPYKSFPTSGAFANVSYQHLKASQGHTRSAAGGNKHHLGICGLLPDNHKVLSEAWAMENTSSSYGLSCLPPGPTARQLVGAALALMVRRWRGDLLPHFKKGTKRLVPVSLQPVASAGEAQDHPGNASHLACEHELQPHPSGKSHSLTVGKT